ncbi:MAG: serine/threonine protein kinase, partial [Deltaproteobacteria bacterium]
STTPPLTIMAHDDGEITTPIPRGRQQQVADRVRVRRGVAVVEQDTAEVAAHAARRLVDRNRGGPLVVQGGAASRPRSKSLRSGAVVGGHYRIVNRIARGGTAVVYRADHLTLGRRVALKILTPPGVGPGDAQFERRFILEARTLAALSHPNIVEVLDFGRLEDGRCYLAMELLDGPRLDEWFRNPAVTALERLDALIGVARGIAHAHERGVIHRDIKLSNVMIVRTARGPVAKVLDFGLAKLLDGDNQELTQHGVTMGSPHFMSPEQARGWPLDEGTDIYSLGILAWCAFTGSFPYSGPNATATMLQHVVDPVPYLGDVEQTHPAPPGLADIVRRCMAKNRADRFASMRELTDELIAVRNRAARGRVERRLLPPPPPPSRLREPLNPSERRLVLLACLLMSLACLWWQERGLVDPPWVRVYVRSNLL